LFDRKVSRPEASITKRARQRRGAPSSSVAHLGAVGVEENFAHAAAFERLRAARGRVVEQDLVHLRAPHLPCKRHRFVPGVGESDARGVFVVGRDEFGAELAHADALDLLAHTELVEQRDVGRQQRFADVKARVTRLLDHHHAAAFAGQYGGGGGSSRAAADNEDVAGFERGDGLGGRSVHAGPWDEAGSRPGKVWRLAAGLSQNEMEHSVRHRPGRFARRQ
jgi:hypothetical protein